MFLKALQNCLYHIQPFAAALFKLAQVMEALSVAAVFSSFAGATILAFRKYSSVTGALFLAGLSTLAGGVTWKPGQINVFTSPGIFIVISACDDHSDNDNNMMMMMTTTTVTIMMMITTATIVMI